ncbi:hypothetical protein GW17_00025043 [Ensete ventricosum]|nr:hypothetical protein GW17_00025043 [Ensete ventricosum]
MKPFFFLIVYFLFQISCSDRDKLLHLLALLKLELVQKKVLIFVNSIDNGFRIRLFLEQFGIRSSVLNAELPQNSRLHILEVSSAEEGILAEVKSMFGDGDNEELSNCIVPFPLLTKNAVESLRYRAEQGLQFDLYCPVRVVHIGSSGYRYVDCPLPGSTTKIDRQQLIEGEKGKKKKRKRRREEEKRRKKYALSLRRRPRPRAIFLPRAEKDRGNDVAKGVTRIAVRESRAQDLRNEILNSEKLKAHFEDNPKDLGKMEDLHLAFASTLLSKKAPPSHLREVPEYLVDLTTKEASKILKLTRAAMGIKASKKRPGFRRGLGRSRDPLKTFSAEVT